MMEELSGRFVAVQQALKKAKLGGMLVENRQNSYYLSGFPASSSIILITAKQSFFFTDSRYFLLAEKRIAHMEVRLMTQRALTQVADVVRKIGLKRLGFEESVAYSQFTALQKNFENTELVPSGQILRDLRIVKSVHEQQIIARNQRLNQKVYKSALAFVEPGMRETDVRDFILRQMIENQCEEAFDSIIAAGPNSANPHAVPGKEKIKPGQLLLFDMGVKQNHYHSDMTRTVAVGESLPPKCAEIYEVVRLAQAAALKELGPGVPCRQVDAAARNIIISAGYGEYFGHGLGHGVGLEIHEGPTLNPRSNETLQPGMVVTVEPGIYLPGIGGVRIEDLLVITESGAKNLTSVSKTLSFV